MSTNFEKVKVATGRDSSNNFDLSCYHATTATFYRPAITYFHEFVPGEKWKMDARTSVRCLPMIKPAIADIKVHNRFFFVPYFSIMKNWNEFLAETPIYIGNVQRHSIVPQIAEATLIDCLKDANFSFNPVPEDEEPDFRIYSSDFRSYTAYKFTELGRTAYSILNGLGYVCNFESRNVVSKMHQFSALPLLAYLKVYADWFNNTTFDNQLNLNKYFELDGTELSNGDLDEILIAVCHTYLDKDYFTASSLYPVGTNSTSSMMAHSIPDITGPGSRNGLVVNSNPSSTSFHGTPIVEQRAADGTVVSSKYSIDAVNALTDYVKRHQLAGIQPFNRILAEYGVSLDNEVLKRSTYIGDCLESLDIQSVISQSYADDTVLGDRAGLANAGGQKNLDFSNGNFGAIICVTTIVPKTSYVDGIKRHCLRRNRFDFFTPSLEHLGTEPVYQAELFNRYDFQNLHSWSYRPDAEDIFGYMPRYAAYKTALDSISGDFVVGSRRAMYEAWILQRKLKLYRPSNLVISNDFLSSDPANVSPIFVDNTQDNFIIFNMYHVNARLPMHQLFDDYQWSNEEDNPQHVTIANQGVQLT